ncbi:hypothetical protein EDB19DRAFT_1201615 [Suillus lakei]|nr:hypothetical protein EDB19DRAFT_1201615 [Suillus lakei]
MDRHFCCLLSPRFPGHHTLIHFSPWWFSILVFPLAWMVSCPLAIPSCFSLRKSSCDSHPTPTSLIDTWAAPSSTPTTNHRGKKGQKKSKVHWRINRPYRSNDDKVTLRRKGEARRLRRKERLLFGFGNQYRVLCADQDLRLQNRYRWDNMHNKINSSIAMPRCDIDHLECHRR